MPSAEAAYRAVGSDDARTPPVGRVGRLLRRLALAAVCVPLLSFATPANASTALPPQGLYDWCAPGATPDRCVGRLQLMGQAGFRVVLNYQMLAQSNPQQVISYVHSAQANGLQVIWPLYDFSFQNPLDNNMVSVYPKLAAACGCSTNLALANYVVGLAKGEPDTWGYYLADEPDPSIHALIQAFSLTVRAIDPTRPQLLVANGGGPISTLLGPFADINATLSADTYPVTTQSPDPAGAYNVTASVTQSVQALADTAGRPSAMVLQSFNWGDTYYNMCGSSPSNCRFPTEQEMQAQRDAAIQNGHPQVILWFALFDLIGFPAGQGSPDFNNVPSNLGNRWNDLVQAAFAPPPASNQPPPDTNPTSSISPIRHPSHIQKCPRVQRHRHGKRRAHRRCRPQHHHKTQHHHSASIARRGKTAL